MNVLTNLTLTLAALMPTAPATEKPPMPAFTPMATAAAEATDLQAQARLDWVISPWGYRDLYAVHRGWNRLVCSGTGLLFSYYAY